MKKIFYIGMPILFFLLVSACTSTSTAVSMSPHVYTHTSTEFEILGEVLHESSDRVGYNELLRVARNLYPDCDYVIDIMIDQRVTAITTKTSYFPINLIFFLLRDTQSTETRSTWVMRGTAIMYKR